MHGAGEKCMTFMLENVKGRDCLGDRHRC